MLRSAKSVVGALRSHRPSPQMALPHLNGSAFSDSRRHASHTITSLKRWSIAGKEIPAASQIKTIHVYDFDNTLFCSPLPNPQLWNGSTIGFLQTYESFAGGGWWHDQNILCATGEGADVEETRAWQGWWNESVVQLVELSMKQKDALTVLLTGRGEANFADIVKRIIASRKLEFDLVCLKPEVGPNGQQFSTTMSFKQSFLESLIVTYNQADEIRVYEDRIKHVKEFRDYFEKVNRIYFQAPNSRKPIVAEVIHIAEGTRYLDPVTEVAEVQNLINAHNSRYHDSLRNLTKSSYGRLHIKRTVFYTGYLIGNVDSSRLVSEVLQPVLPSGLVDSGEFKYLANSILITPRPASRTILDRVGGIGKKISWQITGIGHWDHKLWAARVQPVPANETIYTENQVPMIVLGLCKGARPVDSARIQNWQPVAADKALVVETTVGERVNLRVEEKDLNEGEWESQFANKNNKRRRPHGRMDDDNTNSARDFRGANTFQALSEHGSHGRSQQQGGRNQNESHHRSRGRGGRSSGSGRGRGNPSRGGGRRGRGGNAGGSGNGPGGYRSLDDQQMGGDGAYDSHNGQGNPGGGIPLNY
ncbi:hypothetical protein BGW36DRAFT_301357 [Talaromyces proteolyticus]|uniref:Swiss Army Knife RNA repair protein HAD domain-containing protein n=1 Tax=Talaromyces proteolyticus TaxID=1131652 RepID=A0AAD4KJV6_9EURO|nr:uncharacterized protein BGW36DRAFT_301357 [Talaromyces proteolyticus]KAH8693946.1 hypothetical protein BGW36DRAFT_301357 [Talaromyces proteolyticus]